HTIACFDMATDGARRNRIVGMLNQDHAGIAKRLIDGRGDSPSVLQEDGVPLNWRAVLERRHSRVQATRECPDRASAPGKAPVRAERRTTANIVDVDDLSGVSVNRQPHEASVTPERADLIVATPI